MRLTVDCIEDIDQFAEKFVFPVRLSSAYSLGWGRVANNFSELYELTKKGLDNSPTREIYLNWKEKK